MTKKLHQREPPPSKRDTAVEVDVIEKLGGYDNMISQGAEGRVFAVQFLNRPAIVKQRFKKTYRHPVLDAKITRSRLTSEARAIVRARKLGVTTPTIYHVDTQQNAIYMERVQGRPLKELIREGMSEEDMRRVGEDVQTRRRHARRRAHPRRPHHQQHPGARGRRARGDHRFRAGAQQHHRGG